MLNGRSMLVARHHLEPETLENGHERATGRPSEAVVNTPDLLIRQPRASSLP
jgi:hypothetical protein